MRALEWGMQVAWSIFVTAMGLLFVFEGILPFISPQIWRNLMQQMILQRDRAIRIMGLISMLIGLVIVTLVRDFY